MRMSKSRLEWKVGLFVFICLAVLAGLLLMFDKGITLFSPTMNIYLRSANVSGLKARADVLMAGVRVGAVSALNLDPDGRSVTIVLRIYNQYQIHSDARFILEQSGFLGDEYVAILPTKNQGRLLRNGDVANAEVPFNMLEAARSANGFIQRITQTASNLNDAIDEVRRDVLNENTLTNLHEAVLNFRVMSETGRATLTNLASLVQTNKPVLSESLSNLLVISEKLGLSADKLHQLLATNGNQITDVVSNVDASALELKALLADVQAGKGPVGTLLKNEQMAGDLAGITSNLSVTTSNLNRLGLWGILWQHKPPKTKEPVTALATPKGSD
ncbi:Mammalian cell entry related domain protein [Verrucomicrobia bacterium]|nr:Mammalian cell entry related domain protein [Verrucomicrobiota bacterium]